MTFSSLFGEWLKTERKARGLSQEQAAEVAGVSREHWGRCERGQGVLGGEALAGLAAVGWDVTYLLTGQRVRIPPPGPSLRDGEAELLEGYRALDARGRLGVKALIAGMAPAGMNAQSNGGHVIQGSSNVVIGNPAPTPTKRRVKPGV